MCWGSGPVSFRPDPPSYFAKINCHVNLSHVEPEAASPMTREGEILAPVLSVYGNLLSVVLSFSDSVSGEDPILIPNDLMTQHFPHHLISLMVEEQTYTYDHLIINYKSSKVWII